MGGRNRSEMCCIVLAKIKLSDRFARFQWRILAAAAATRWSQQRRIQGGHGGNGIDHCLAF